jgi:branched-chain amino acid transport system ATP-binding protein
MSAAAIIEAQDLHTYYGTSHVLHGIDFAVRQGEVVGLMGRNGMGKTTLIRTLLGWAGAPQRGSHRRPGHDPCRAAPYRPLGSPTFPRTRHFANHPWRISHGRPDRWQNLGTSNACWKPSASVERSHGVAFRRRTADAHITAPDQPGLLLLDQPPGLAPLIAREICAFAAIGAAASRVIIVDKNFAAVSALTDRNVILLKQIVSKGAATS